MLDIHLVADRIARERRKLGLTQAELCRRGGVSRATLDALENGRLGEIGFIKLTRICTALGLHFILDTERAPRPTLDDLLAQQVDESFDSDD